MDGKTIPQETQQTPEVRFQFDTTLGQAAVDGNQMPLMLFALRRGNRKGWLYGRILVILLALALCLLGVQVITLLALLLAAFSLWDLYNLTISGLRRQLRSCIRFAKKQPRSRFSQASPVRIFFSDAEFSVWNPDEQRKLMGFPLQRLFTVESDSLFFITFEQRIRGLRRQTSRTTTVVRKDAITYGTTEEFRTFLQSFAKSPIKTYDISFPEVQELMDELNQCSLQALSAEQAHS